MLFNIFRLLKASFYRMMQSPWIQGSTLEITNSVKLSGEYFTLFVLKYWHLNLLNVYLYVLLSVHLHLKFIVLLWWACVLVTWLKESLAEDRALSSLFIQTLQLGNGFITFVITISSTRDLVISDVTINMFFARLMLSGVGASSNMCLCYQNSPACCVIYS